MSKLCVLLRVGGGGIKWFTLKWKSLCFDLFNASKAFIGPSLKRSSVVRSFRTSGRTLLVPNLSVLLRFFSGRGWNPFYSERGGGINSDSPNRIRHTKQPLYPIVHQLGSRPCTVENGLSTPFCTNPAAGSPPYKTASLPRPVRRILIDIFATAGN